MYGQEGVKAALAGELSSGRAMREDRQLLDPRANQVKHSAGLAEALERLSKATSQAEETMAMLCSRLEPVSLSAPPRTAAPSPISPERPYCDIAQNVRRMADRVWMLQAMAQDALERLDF